jgi:hypothetical protein
MGYPFLPLALTRGSKSHRGARNGQEKDPDRLLYQGRQEPISERQADVKTVKTPVRFASMVLLNHLRHEMEESSH